jgi:hypothetical protein
MIIRRLDKSSISPQDANIPIFQSWIVESDRVSNINDSDFPDDVEVERAPFINHHDLDPKGGRIIEGQAETFIGRKTLVSQWDPVQAASATRIDLNVVASANPLFPDFQHHNSNVFSMVDNFQYTDNKGSTAYLQKAKADYFVVGWHSTPDNDPMTTSSKVQAPIHSDRMDSCQMQLKDSSTPLAKNWLSSAAATRVLCHASMYDVQWDQGSTPGNVLADTIGKQMKDSHSISVGNTPLDVCFYPD